MSIEMTGSHEHRGDYLTDPVVLYDDVDGMAFGPTFEDRAEAEAFLRWHESNFMDGIWKLKTAPFDRQKEIADKWRNLLLTHTQENCPYDVDQDSYGVGFTGDSDKSYGDYTMATPDRCGCECHRAQEVKNG